MIYAVFDSNIKEYNINFENVISLKEINQFYLIQVTL